MKTILSTFALLLALGVPLVSSANDVDCQSEFTILEGAIKAAEYTNQIDETKLLGKEAQAVGKLALDKYADAEQKLADINSKVKELRDARKPKIGNYAEIEDILDAVDVVLACIPGGWNSLPHK